MKKLLLGLTLVVSLTAFANSKEDRIEHDLMNKYPTITDGATAIKIHEYDVDIDHDKIKVKIELKGDQYKDEFLKVDKAKFEAIAAEMAKYAQTESDKKLPVIVEVELDRDLLPDETLYKNTF